MYKGYMNNQASSYNGMGRTVSDTRNRPCKVVVPMGEDTINSLIHRRNDFGNNYRTLVAIKISPYSYVTIGFAQGNIDNYAVFAHRYTRVRPHHYALNKAPWMRDFQLMGKFQSVAQKYNMRKTVINDFMQVFNHTGDTCDPQNDWVFNHLNELSSHYPMSSAMGLYFAVLHLSMISECKYKRQGRWGMKKSLLGKRVKFIGFYQALVLGWNSHKVANFSKHVDHNYLLNLYKQYRKNLATLTEKSPRYEYVY